MPTNTIHKPHHTMAQDHPARVYLRENSNSPMSSITFGLRRQLLINNCSMRVRAPSSGPQSAGARIPLVMPRALDKVQRQSHQVASGTRLVRDDQRALTGVLSNPEYQRKNHN